MENDPRAERVIRREERKFEKDRAKLEAYEQNMKDTIAAFLKDVNNKNTLGKDLRRAAKEPSRRDEMKRYSDGSYDDDKEIITGLEARPWER